MKGVQRAKWIATFDMEPLISLILKGGMALSVILILSGMALNWISGANNDFGPNLHAKSILVLIWEDLALSSMPEFWPRLLIHLAFSVLLLTPCIRVFVSMLYFAFLENNWKYVIFTSIVLIILTITLLTQFV